MTVVLELLGGLYFFMLHWVWWGCALYIFWLILSYGCVSDYYQRGSNYVPLLVRMVPPVQPGEDSKRIFYFAIDFVCAALIFPSFMVLIVFKVLSN